MEGFKLDVTNFYERNIVGYIENLQEHPLNLFMLILDFEQVKSMVYGGFDKRYEWMASLGLMITIIWIYIEVIRIVAIFANRD